MCIHMYFCAGNNRTYWSVGDTLALCFPSKALLSAFFPLDSGVQRNAEFGWTGEAHRLHAVQHIVSVCCIVQMKRALSCGGRLVGM